MSGNIEAKHKVLRGHGITEEFDNQLWHVFGMAISDAGGFVSDETRSLNNYITYPKIMAYSSHHYEIESLTTMMQGNVIESPMSGGELAY